MLFLPQRDAGRFRLDQPIGFWAFALDRDGAARFAELSRDSLTAAEAAQVPSGKVRLELIARGVGRLDVGATNLYHEITRGDSVVMEFTLRNTGSRLVNDVRLAADLRPTGAPRSRRSWCSTVPIDGEARVRLVLVPPRDIPVGDYDVKVRTVALSADRQVDTEDKTVRVHVTQPAGVGGDGVPGGAARRPGGRHGVVRTQAHEEVDGAMTRTMRLGMRGGAAGAGAGGCWTRRW